MDTQRSFLGTVHDEIKSRLNETDNPYFKSDLMIGAVTALSEKQFFGILTILNDQTLVVALKMRELEQQMKGLDTTLIRQELRKALS